MKIAYALALIAVVGLVAADDPTPCCLAHSLSVWGISFNMFEGERTLFSANVDYGHDEQPSMAHFYISPEYGEDYQVVHRADKERMFVVYDDGTCEIHPAEGSMNPCVNPEASFVSEATIGNGAVNNFYYLNEEYDMEAWYTISTEECRLANVYVNSREWGSVAETLYFDMVDKEFELEEFAIPEPCLIPELTTVHEAGSKAAEKYTNLLRLDW